ncbi:hypothetical protein B0J17DRAFT_108150 [Rhizoctonia solani]|nr:hypothetical protein B0J17DRAFT_108150 [Rhizoctonia solani]
MSTWLGAAFVHSFPVHCFVCSQWRRICTNSPLLWNCVHIETFPLSRFTIQCIERAKGVPVLLNINPSNGKQVSARSAGGHWPFADYAEPLPRYRSATFRSPLLSTSLNPWLPSLRSLELKRIHLGHLLYHNPPLIPTALTCLNLKEAGLEHYPPNTFALLLASSIHLEQLSIMDYIDLTDESFNSWSIISPILFSDLRRLKLQVMEPYALVGTGLRWVTHFLRSIEAPGLEQLIVISPTEYTVGNDNIEQFADFISTGNVPDQRVGTERYPLCKSLYPKLRYFGALLPLPKGEDTRAVDRTPRCSPNLAYLSLGSPILSEPKLGDVLHRRQEAGFPIRVVALLDDENTRELPSTVQVKFYHDSQVFDFLDL